MKKKMERKLYIASIVLATIGGLLMIWFLIALGGYHLISIYRKLDLNNASNIGEFVGGVIGTLFTIVGIFLLYLTYHTQKKELGATKKELKLSRKAFESQNKTSQIQQFESTFFNLLSNHHEIINGINQKWFNGEIDQYQLKLEARQLFDRLVTTIKVFYDYNEEELEIILLEEDPVETNWELSNFGSKFNGIMGRERLIQVFQFLYDHHRSSLGHYFRNLFHYIKFVDEYQGFNNIYSKKKIKKIKYKYVRIIRAQLSANEIVLLWYNSLMPFGKPFQSYLQKYKLLKNIDPNAEIAALELMLEDHPYLREELGPKILQKNTEESHKKKEPRVYQQGPKGGCYYINSKKKKIYVDSSFCEQK